MLKKEREIEQRLRTRIANEEIRPIVDEKRQQLIDEHRERPLGPHSDDLYRVLTFLRRRSVRGKHIIVMTKPFEEWTLAKLAGAAGEAPEMLDERFESEAAAEHAVFVKRLEEFEEKYVEETDVEGERR